MSNAMTTRKDPPHAAPSLPGDDDRPSMTDFDDDSLSQWERQRSSRKLRAVPELVPPSDRGSL